MPFLIFVSKYFSAIDNNNLTTVSGNIFDKVTDLRKLWVPLPFQRPLLLWSSYTDYLMMQNWLNENKIISYDLVFVNNNITWFFFQTILFKWINLIFKFTQIHLISFLHSILCCSVCIVSIRFVILLVFPSSEKKHMLRWRKKRYFEIFI